MRCKKQLYTLVVRDKEQADNLLIELPPGLILKPDQNVHRKATIERLQEKEKAKGAAKGSGNIGDDEEPGGNKRRLATDGEASNGAKAARRIVVPS